MTAGRALAYVLRVGDDRVRNFLEHGRGMVRRTTVSRTSWHTVVKKELDSEQQSEVRDKRSRESYLIETPPAAGSPLSPSSNGSPIDDDKLSSFPPSSRRSPIDDG